MQLDNLTTHLVIAAAIVVLFVLMTRIVQKVLGFIGRKFFAKTETVLDDKILAVVERHAGGVMLLIGLFIAVREVRKGTVASDVTLLQVLEYVDSLLYIAGVLLAVKILLGIIQELIHWYLDRISSEGAISLKKTLGPLTDKAVDLLVGFVAVIVILDHFGINIGSLLVSLGVGSLAVALAAQDTLANMIAGFVILVDRPFRVGDRIELMPGVLGDVTEIGLRSTKLMGFDNNTIIIPNADLVKGRIVNYAFPQGQMRVMLKFDVAYGVDVSRVREILIGLVSAHPDVLAEPAPQVFLTSMTESSIQVTMVARCRDYSLQFGAETTLREQAYQAFLREGIRVPVTQRIVHMKTEA